jgi:DNA-binding CsgD family transcriptional regulator
MGADVAHTTRICIYGELRTFLRRRFTPSLRKNLLAIFANFNPRTVVYTFGGFCFVPRKAGSKRRRKPRQKAILVATQQGKIHFADLPARRWLKQFFGRPKTSGKLPIKVLRWLSTHKRAGAASLIGKQESAQLYVRREHSYTEDSVVLLLELIKAKSANRLRQHRQLTPREREVLFWLGKGKSNAEIGLILGIASATVSKHLERIYPKINVENRTAACSVSVEALSE